MIFGEVRGTISDRVAEELAKGQLALSPALQRLMTVYASEYDKNEARRAAEQSLSGGFNTLVGDFLLDGVERGVKMAVTSLFPPAHAALFMFDLNEAHGDEITYYARMVEAAAKAELPGFRRLDITLGGESYQVIVDITTAGTGEGYNSRAEYHVLDSAGNPANRRFAKALDRLSSGNASQQEEAEMAAADIIRVGYDEFGDCLAEGFVHEQDGGFVFDTKAFNQHLLDGGYILGPYASGLNRQYPGQTETADNTQPPPTGSSNWDPDIPYPSPKPGL